MMKVRYFHSEKNDIETITLKIRGNIEIINVKQESKQLKNEHTLHLRFLFYFDADGST